MTKINDNKLTHKIKNKHNRHNKPNENITPIYTNIISYPYSPNLSEI